MHLFSANRRALAVTLFVLATLLIAAPIRRVWASASLPWWTPFALWALLVVAAFVVARPEATQERP